MRPKLLLLCIVLSCCYSVLCVRMQRPIGTTTFSSGVLEKTLSKNDDEFGDRNGNVFEADTSFDVIEQPLTVIDSADGLLGKVPSQALDKQNEEMKEYLEDGDNHLVVIVDNTTATPAAQPTPVENPAIKAFLESSRKTADSQIQQNTDNVQNSNVELQPDVQPNMVNQQAEAQPELTENTQEPNVDVNLQPEIQSPLLNQNPEAPSELADNAQKANVDLQPTLPEPQLNQQPEIQPADNTQKSDAELQPYIQLPQLNQQSEAQPQPQLAENTQNLNVELQPYIQLPQLTQQPEAQPADNTQKSDADLQPYIQLPQLNEQSEAQTQPETSFDTNRLAEKERFNLKGSAALAQESQEKPAVVTNLFEMSANEVETLPYPITAGSNIGSYENIMSLSSGTSTQEPDQETETEEVEPESIDEQDYEVEEVYWRNRHTRVRVVRPILRDLSDPISILFFMVLAFLMIGTIILVRETINRWMQKNFGASLDAILKDIITLYLIITLLRILDYFDIFLDLEYYVNMRLVSVSFLVFSIFWLILGVYSVLRCHGFVKSWNNLEKDFPKRDQIFRQYENLYLELNRTKKQQKEMEEKRQQLEYFLIRQEFVFPTFLPVLGEAFLRDDFNFATYMAKSLARASDSMFKYSFISLLTIIIIGAFWLFFAGLLVKTQVFILGALPIVIFLMFLAMNLKLNKIYRKLVQIVDSPYDVNFTKFDNLRQPLINLDKLKVPEYLSESNPQTSGSRIFSTFRMPNRHEKLFWLASPRFMVRLTHIILILQIIWLAVLALAFGGNLEDYRQIILVVVGVLLTLVNLLYFVPTNLRIFCLTTSIQMLKDRKIVAEVIDDNKRRNAELFMKLFRLLKSRSREQRFGDTRAVSLREVIIDQVRTYFQSLPKEENDKISILHLKDLAHYCGADLSDEEIVYLSRSSKDADNKVAFPNLMEAIEKFVDDVRQDKFRMIRDTLKSIIKRDDGMVSLRELRDAITESQILPQEEIDAMMHEIRYLPFRNAEISIDLVARFIRDAIEGMPV